MKKITIQETNQKEFQLRPQLHILLVSPFGTFKSSITKKLEKEHPYKIHPADDFSRPGLEGSITRDGDYVPPLITQLGGKILIIDEWNNVDFFGQRALLGLLENQRVSRTIGFKVKTPYKYRGKYGYFIIKENRITGSMLFSCIAYAMEYPVREGSQRDKALLSRFTPLFVQPNLTYMKAQTRGEFEINISDQSGEVEEVIIEKEAYLDFHEQYYNYIQLKDLIPLDSDDYGFLSRTMSDIIRFGVYNYLEKNPEEKKNKKIIIKNAFYFREMFIYIHTLLQQYTHPKTKGKLWQYKQLLRKYPNKKKEFYYKTLGVSRQTLYEYDQKLGNIKP